MIRVFDFLCSAGHVEERFILRDERTVVCSDCGAVAYRMIAGARSQLEGISGAFPSAADKWVRDRESHMRRESKYMASHNEVLPGVKGPKEPKIK
jgi:hypothetical protein